MKATICLIALTFALSISTAPAASEEGTAKKKAAAKKKKTTE